MLNAWLHLIALIVYLGAIGGLWLLLLPSLSVIEKHENRANFLARGLKFYNPLQVGALGILLFTGAFQLTELKAIYREAFVKQIGYDLGMKLLFAFLLVIFSVYQSMGIGHRFVRRHEGGEPVTAQELESVVRRLRSSNWCILFFALITFWFGLRLRS
ncbi:MAG TPA: hypothetical protein VNY32_11360 [Candidatus Acidoferrales bacterium]|nr:hypothetical protein [Candidatus Acidoferrales bacterium]